MTEFRIIPVLDLLTLPGAKKPVSVHAIRGRRDEYKPLQSNLFPSSNPLHIIEILSGRHSFAEIYVADLDAILREEPNLELLTKISGLASSGILLDPGIKNMENLKQYMDLDLGSLILGLETLDNLRVIERALDMLGQDHLTLSVDLFKDQLLTRIPSLEGCAPMELVIKIQNMGIKEIILLDLDRVGSKKGGIPETFLRIRDTFPDRILIGGGTKNAADLREYKDAGFSGVLIATALYDESIPLDVIKKMRKGGSIHS